MPIIESIQIYTDGASRKNPGNAAIAFAIYDQKGNLLKEYSEPIGVCTNNIAEYMALIKALEEGSTFCRGEVFCFCDSELIVNQMNGSYRIKRPHLKQLFLQVKEKEKMYKKVTYAFVPRENERIAKVDKLVNKQLDRGMINFK